MTYMTYFPFMYLQKDKNIKIVARVLIIIVANLLFVVIFYSSKLYIILFVPKKNTAKYLQQEMLEISKQRTDADLKSRIASTDIWSQNYAI